MKPAVRRGLAAGRRGSHIATERGQIVLEDERVPQQLLHHGQGHEHQQEGAPKGQYKEYTDRGGGTTEGPEDGRGSLLLVCAGPWRTSAASATA